MRKKNSFRVALFVVGLVVASHEFRTVACAQATDAQPAIAKRIGTIKSVNGNALTLAPTAGPEVAVTVQATARILRLAPGEKDLKNATPLTLDDLHVGDTVRVRGSASGDGNSISALEIIVITQAAVAAAGDQKRQDWQKRGTSGRVQSVDVSAGTVTLSIPSLTAKKTVLVHTTSSTVVYRYSADSAKSEDARRSNLAEIQVDDQCRALGNKNADGTEVAAEEIYAGAFPQYPATVKSVDVASGVISVTDLVTKKTVQVKVSGDSQLHKIPAEMAQMVAMRLKGAMAGVPGAGSAGGKPAAASNGQAPSPAGSTWSGGGGNGGGARSNGPPDFQRILSRLPSSSLADLNLQKGDAVMILATPGTSTTPQTAITLLSGVEPILQAAPTASQAMMLTPWNLGGGPGGDASQ